MFIGIGDKPKHPLALWEQFFRYPLVSTRKDRKLQMASRLTCCSAMICLRCGNCCVHLDIAIIDPKSILPDGTINPNRSMAIIFKPAGERCPHLVFDGETAVCTIHHLSCYRGTPCDEFEQLGPENSVCIMSGYFRKLGSRKIAKL